MQVIAIDWSGREHGAAEAIWFARVRDGALVELENGMEREEAIAAAIGAARRDPRTVIGLDFAFAFPAWYSERQGWATGRDVWDAMRDGAEALLEACEPPFWGRPGSRAQTLGPALRETEADAPATPKSVFQIAGAGAVGTGSLRGMRHLADLADAGVAIWPFDDPQLPTAVEIYPRALTGPVLKRRHRARRGYLARRFPGQDAVMRERAAGSEDAFDAAVSALVMAAHHDELAALPPVPAGSRLRLEGAIWIPGRGDEARPPALRDGTDRG
jgi:hypothetical protein